MKYLNGKPAMKGDTVIFETPDGTVLSGNVSQFYDRHDQLAVSGYPLRVQSGKAVLASDALSALKATLTPNAS